LNAEEQLISSGCTGTATTVLDYLREALLDPNAHLSTKCPGGTCVSGLMPAYTDGTLTDAEINAIINFMAKLPDLEITEPVAAEEQEPPEEMDNEESGSQLAP
jgi:hypothetical protein